MFDNLFSIAGKVAVVTGGSRGIGEMIAAGFLANGAKVYISSRKADACDETARRLSEQFGGECISIPANLAGLPGIQAFADELSKREQRLDILVNNAGVSWGAPLDEFPELGWDKVMDTNVKGVFFLTQKLLPLLRASASAEDPARVINVGSIDGLKTPVFDTLFLRAVESGCASPHAGAGRPSGEREHPGQRHRAGAVPHLHAQHRGWRPRRCRADRLGCGGSRQPPRSGGHGGGHRRHRDLLELPCGGLHGGRSDHLRRRLRGVVLGLAQALCTILACS